MSYPEAMNVIFFSTICVYHVVLSVITGHVLYRIISHVDVVSNHQLSLAITMICFVIASCSAGIIIVFHVFFANQVQSIYQSNPIAVLMIVFQEAIPVRVTVIESDSYHVYPINPENIGHHIFSRIICHVFILVFQFQSIVCIDILCHRSPVLKSIFTLIHVLIVQSISRIYHVILEPESYRIHVIVTLSALSIVIVDHVVFMLVVPVV